MAEGAAGTEGPEGAAGTAGTEGAAGAARATPRLAPFRFNGAVAVVTGAAGGMGEQLAYGLALKGTHLVLVDRDAERLATVAQTVTRRRPEIRVRTLVADLSDADAVAKLAAEIMDAEPVVNLLINNAGVALAGTFAQTSAEESDWVMAVNFAAPVALTRALLPRLRESAGSHIVNTSSLFGLIAPPGQSAYSASKFALRGFTEALRHELAGEVGVTCVHPGGIKTRIALDARVASGADQERSEQAMRAFNKVLTYPADRAAARIIEGVRRRRGRVLIAMSARVPDLLARLFPATYWDAFVRLNPRANRRG
ncbi:SDR family NAD(P)-dependent oxidoreductase [Catenulispora pinisilvae]|uniref:SDR family NAD(P)-dependent oxidoreductase n=1 Tax=Catenulispora pinisilvae TaxID=2705253 RepID=UPI001E5689F3|nr:SDR family NAD(P)-dependent oxidoreductase [Catenulispora pinisilvae]